MRALFLNILMISILLAIIDTSMSCAQNKTQATFPELEGKLIFSLSDTNQIDSWEIWGVCSGDRKTYVWNDIYSPHIPICLGPNNSLLLLTGVLQSLHSDPTSQYSDRSLVIYDSVCRPLFNLDQNGFRCITVDYLRSNDMYLYVGDYNNVPGVYIWTGAMENHRDITDQIIYSLDACKGKTHQSRSSLVIDIGVHLLNETEIVISFLDCTYRMNLLDSTVTYMGDYCISSLSPDRTMMLTYKADDSTQQMQAFLVDLSIGETDTLHLDFDFAPISCFSPDSKAILLCDWNNDFEQDIGFRVYELESKQVKPCSMYYRIFSGYLPPVWVSDSLPLPTAYRPANK